MRVSPISAWNISSCIGAAWKQTAEFNLVLGGQCHNALCAERYNLHSFLIILTHAYSPAFGGLRLIAGYGLVEDRV